MTKSFRSRTLVLLSSICLSAVQAHAQIVQSVSRFAAAGQPESKVADSATAGADKVQTLPQANVDTSSEGTKVGIQAADLYLTRYLRFYGRLTLPVTQKVATSDAQSSQSSATAATAKLPTTVKQQLVDPYGGLFNMSGGWFQCVLPYDATETQKDTRQQNRTVQSNIFSRLKADASVADPAKTASDAQVQHGLFVDVRGGLKFIELPDPGDSNPDVAGTKANVFYSGIVGVKSIAALYDDPTWTDAHRTGGLTVGLYFVYNFAADTTQSSVYGTLLDKQTTAWTAVVGWDLPGTDVAALTFSFTPHTSDKRLGKTFTFGLTLKNKSAGDKSH